MKLLNIISASLLSILVAFSSSAFAGGHGMKKDIVDTAFAAGSFTTLVAAVQAADLVDTLKGEGPFTVFAPNDDAFAKIPAATLNGLIADKEALTGILGLHVVSGKVMAADAISLGEATTITGGALTIMVKGDDVYVNGAKVIATDIETSNGVIHVLDTVITK